MDEYLLATTDLWIHVHCNFVVTCLYKQKLMLAWRRKNAECKYIICVCVCPCKPLGCHSERFTGVVATTFGWGNYGSTCSLQPPSSNPSATWSAKCSTTSNLGLQIKQRRETQQRWKVFKLIMICPKYMWHAWLQEYLLCFTGEQATQLFMIHFPMLKGSHGYQL